MTLAVNLAQSASNNVTFRNRIINGAMMIDQRNAGASVTQNTSVQYTLDRWFAYGNVTSKFSVQQNAGSVTPPAGFKNYLGVTSLSAYSVASNDVFVISQRIEGFNIADLAWGTANAQPITLSFWVRSSLTGTFGGGLRNSDTNRAYPFSYTISTANTWEYKTITIAGDTTGTWGTSNGIGVEVDISLGMGSAYSNTAGYWTSGNYLSATGATSVVGTNGATLYITGVQFEEGTAASPFEYRSYGQELALCQRYFEKSYNTDTAVGTVTAVGYFTLCGGTNTGSNVIMPIRWKVEKRAAPTFTFYNLTNGATGTWQYARSGASGDVSMVVDNVGTSGCRIYGGVGAAWTVAFVEGQWIASSEL